MYSPKINDEDLIKRLYKLKLEKKKPMTWLISDALSQYLEKEERKLKASPNTSKE